MLAVGADLEERDRYREYILAGGKAKDFKWSSPDKAGTGQRVSISDTIMDHMKVNAGSIKPNLERVMRLAEAQGRQVVFVDAEGKAWTVEGEPIQRTLDHFALPITYKSAVQ